MDLTPKISALSLPASSLPFLILGLPASIVSAVISFMVGGKLLAACFAAVSALLVLAAVATAMLHGFADLPDHVPDRGDGHDAGDAHPLR